VSRARPRTAISRRARRSSSRCGRRSATTRSQTTRSTSAHRGQLAHLAPCPCRSQRCSRRDPEAAASTPHPAHRRRPDRRQRPARLRHRWRLVRLRRKPRLRLDRHRRHARPWTDGRRPRHCHARRLSRRTPALDRPRPGRGDHARRPDRGRPRRRHRHRHHRDPERPPASTITWLTCGEHAPILITADGEHRGRARSEPDRAGARPEAGLARAALVSRCRDRSASSPHALVAAGVDERDRRVVRR
jgi:hypothetical protein